uniref:Uncharacterized protein n=1 Tax=Lepeophtheirus salmonis TaxID=72036 RepID=A0A0K2T3J6_LEPSM
MNKCRYIETQKSLFPTQIFEAYLRYVGEKYGLHFRTLNHGILETLNNYAEFLFLDEGNTKGVTIFFLSIPSRGKTWKNKLSYRIPLGE